MDNFKEKKKSYQITSYLLVVFFTLIAFLLPVSIVKASSFYITPASASYETAKTFSLNIFASSKQALNAGSASISFPVDKLEVINISKSGSIFSLWAQEPGFSNKNGTINFEGIVMNPGYAGTNGKIITVTFKTKAAGVANINFSSASILANDGLGTNILDSFTGAKISITNNNDKIIENKDKVVEVGTKVAPDNKPPLPVVVSSTHPDQGKKYNNNNVEFSWELPTGVDGESVYLSRSPDSSLSSVSDGLFTVQNYTNLEDGVWYFHIKFRSHNNWGPTAHYRVQIDTSDEAIFINKLEEDSSLKDEAVADLEVENIADTPREIIIEAEPNNDQSLDSFQPDNKYYQIGIWILNFLTLLVPIFCLLLSLFCLCYYFWNRYKKTKTKLWLNSSGNQNETRDELIKSKKEIKEKIAILISNRERRQKIDRIESVMLENLKQELSEIENSKDVPSM